MQTRGRGHDAGIVVLRRVEEKEMLYAPKLRRDDEMTPPDEEDTAEDRERRRELRDYYEEITQELRRERFDE